MNGRRGVFLFGILLALAVASRAILDSETDRWVEVETRDLVIGVPFEGELEAVSSVTLGPPTVEQMWNFKIADLAPDGKTVREGEPVIRFDPTELQQRLQDKISDRDSAEKELEKRVTDLKIERRNLELRLAEAEAELRRVDFEAAVPEDLVAAVELAVAAVDRRMAELEISHLERNLEYLDTHESAQIASLEEQRRRAAATVEDLQESIRAMTVTAPRAGTVILDVRQGREKLKVGDQVWRAQKVLQIPDLGTMRVEAQVAEADAGRLAVGLPVTFRLDAHPDREYTGRVESVRRAVQPKSRIQPEKVVKAVVSVDETDTERMRPGMRLRGTVEIERLENALVVPEEAIFADSSGAWVWSKGLLFGKERIEPELGSRNDRFFQVISGLDAGDSVWVPGQEEGP